MFILVGRLIVSHTTVRMMFQSPAMCLTTGLGMWYMWFLLLAVVAGAGVHIVWWLFISVFLLLSLFMFKLFKSAPLVTEHFWTMFIFGLVLLFPALLWLGQDAPQFTGEFSESFKSLGQIIHLGAMPHFKQVIQFAVDTLQSPLSALLITLPVHILLDGFLLSSFTVMNVILMILASGALLMSTGVHVKWTNLPLCTAGAFIGVTALNPFFQFSVLTAVMPDYVIALTLLLAFFPLLSPKPLPVGIAVLPIALTLTALVGAHSFAWVLVLFVIVVWILRHIMTFNRGASWDIFGLTLLVCLPLLAHLMWKFYLINSGIKPLLNWHFEGLPLAEVSFAQQIVAAVFVVLVILNGIWKMLHVRHYGGVRMLVLSQGWSLWPAALAIYMLIVYVNFASVEPMNGIFRVFGWLQFVMLVPLWHGWFIFYKKSQWQKIAYKSPWVLGTMLCAVIVAGLFMIKPLFLTPATPVVTHVMSVSKQIKQEKLVQFQQPVAVFDTVANSQNILSFGLHSYAPVGEAPYVFKDRVDFYRQLRKNKFKYVWIHIPTKEVNALFEQNLKENYSYLFEITSNSFKLIKMFPHLSYTSEEL